ncbi:MAG: galactokinase family protein [Pseudomonadota bacterium]|nr:galactokinase family protein [Pseudomonadota bacterium]
MPNYAGVLATEGSSNADVTVLISTKPDIFAADKARVYFKHTFNKEATGIAWAPFRICPVGAHVDHQYGHVAAAAIGIGITVAFRPRDDHLVRIYSHAMEETGEFGTEHVRPKEGIWLDYAKGAVVACKDLVGLKTVRGIDCVVIGGAMGAGLSSSAAVGLVYTLAVASVNGLQLSDQDLIAHDAYIEQRYMGLNNGTLDPATIVLAKADRLCLVETRNNAVTYHRGGTPFQFIVMFSGISEALTPANFNQRVQESWQAAEELKRFASKDIDAPRLGDFGYAEYEEGRHRLSPVSRRRAEHFFSETRRVSRSIDAWEQGDISSLGQLMRESAASSIVNYECGATPVKDLVSILNETPGVAGARFCGPGFRGCCVALLEAAYVNARAQAAVFRAAKKDFADVHKELADLSWMLPCDIADGARLVE